MTVRRVLFWVHLTAGVCAGLVILTMSFTGVLLMYERQLIEWSDRAYHAAPPSDQATRLPIETLLARAAEQRPQQSPTAITLRADHQAPAAVAFGQTTVYQDVYTGRLVGEPTTGVRRFMSEARAWHRWMSLDGDGRAIGKAISGWSNLIFLFIVLSGMYLWIPRVVNWRNVRAVAVFRRGLPGKARDFNWHNVIGIWSAVPLAIVVATAMPISFPWANALVYRIAGEAPPVPAAPAARSNMPPPVERAPQAVATEGLESAVGARRAAGTWLAQHQSPAGCSRRPRHLLDRRGQWRPAAAALDAFAESSDRRRRAVGAVRRSNRGTPASQLDAVHPHGRVLRARRADGGRDRFGGRRRARGDGIVAGASPRSRLARAPGCVGA